MAIRDARDKSARDAAEAARARSGSAGKNDVFSAHGNDFLRDQLLEDERAVQRNEESALDAALEEQQEGAKKAPMTERRAVSELVDSMVHIQNRPQLIEEIMANAESDEERASRMLRYLAEEGLELAVIESLSQASLRNVTDGMVIESEALRAVETDGPAVRDLGYAGAVIWQLVSEALRHTSGLRGGQDEEQSGEASEADVDHGSRALGRVVSILRLAAASPA